MTKLVVTYKITGETQNPSVMTPAELEILKGMEAQGKGLEIVKVRPLTIQSR